MAVLAISIGGSIILQEKKEVDYLNKLAKLLISQSKRNKLFIVVGGGKLARTYIKFARDLGADEAFLDDIGIASTRLNARLLIAALDGHAYPKPAKDFDEAWIASKSHSIVVMGGTHPGHTTDAVAAMLGERVGADRFINATAVDGVYSADPNKTPDAKKFKKLTPQKLLELTVTTEHKAGPHVVIDPLAARIIQRSGIPTYVVLGSDLKALREAFAGKAAAGTLIK
ncbi:MAG: UMP kinase [Thermoplasmata archaeon]|nr:MAG: UMP kinase [Thermoplasmata archaeon]